MHRSGKRCDRRAATGCPASTGGAVGRGNMPAADAPASSVLSVTQAESKPERD